MPEKQIWFLFHSDKKDYLYRLYKNRSDLQVKHIPFPLNLSFDFPPDKIVISDL